MKVMLIVMLIACYLSGCRNHQNNGSSLQENTEEYIRAHGVVQGKVNELRIGGTLFRFPAGVGVTPYTNQEIYRSIDGSQVKLSTKEGLDLGKYEKITKPIVKGQADRAILFLNSKRNYEPGADQFQSGDVRIEITKNGASEYQDSFEKLIQNKSNIVEHPDIGLREYKSDKIWIGSVYEVTLLSLQQPTGNKKIYFGCQPSQVSMSGLCGSSYWSVSGKYSVSIAMEKALFLKNWQGAYSSAIRYVDTLVVK